jgi:hypothetical protein
MLVHSRLQNLSDANAHPHCSAINEAAFGKLKDIKAYSE